VDADTRALDRGAGIAGHTRLLRAVHSRDGVNGGCPLGIEHALLRECEAHHRRRAADVVAMAGVRGRRIS